MFDNPKAIGKKLPFFHPVSLIATICGIGRIPFMPGTLGSLAAYVIFFMMAFFYGRIGYNFISIIYPSLIVLLILFIIGVVSSSLYEKYSEREDASEIVIDEVVGQLLVLYFTVPFFFNIITNKEGELQPLKMIVLFCGPFLLFRIFDIVKPWPANWCDKNIKGGLGVMMDDIVAALMAIMVFNGVMFFILDRKWL